MAFNIYTDDGVLHQNVPSVEMPADASKTIYNKFIAENDVPAAPEGELEVTQNGTYDVTGKASVHVQVEGGSVETEEQTVTPTESAQVVSPSAGKLLSKVTVNPIPSQYIIPSGKKEITANGDNIDVSQYASVKVAVQAAGAPTMIAEYTGSSVVVGTDIETLRSDISVTIAFSNGDEIALGDDEYNLTGSIAVEGGNPLTVSFGGMTDTVTVQGVVPAPVLDHLTASYTGGTVPAGTTLAQLTGITVKAVYSDSSQVTLTSSQYQLSGTLTPGQANTVTVTGLGEYAGKTATFSVTVEAAQPSVGVTKMASCGATGGVNDLSTISATANYNPGVFKDGIVLTTQPTHVKAYPQFNADQTIVGVKVRALEYIEVEKRGDVWAIINAKFTGQTNAAYAEYVNGVVVPSHSAYANFNMKDFDIAFTTNSSGGITGISSITAGVAYNGETLIGSLRFSGQYTDAPTSAAKIDGYKIEVW